MYCVPFLLLMLLLRMCAALFLGTGGCVPRFQQRGHVGEPLCEGPIQGALSRGVCGVWVRAGLQQGCDGVRVAPSCGAAQRRRALRIHGVHAHTRLDELAHDAELTIRGGAVQRGVARLHVEGGNARERRQSVSRCRSIASGTAIGRRVPLCADPGSPDLS